MRGFLIPGVVLIVLAGLLVWTEADRRGVVQELSATRLEAQRAQGELEGRIVDLEAVATKTLHGGVLSSSLPAAGMRRRKC